MSNKIQNAVATTNTETKTMQTYIKSMEGEIKKALPSVITPERFTRMLLTALSVNPKLGKCTPQSFLGAMMSAVQLGVEPNTPLGQAYILPYYNKGTLEAQFQLGYKGLIDLAYKKRTELCHKHGINIVSLDCDGVVEKLIPTWIENGVNVLFPIEIGTWGDQFENARKKYGKQILGVGGMDKTAFRKDKKAVDEEIERIKRLAGMGGFIPCPDHRLMPGSKFELVQYYAEEIKKIEV